MSGTEETNISVFVRTRGRSDREVRENSSVVVTTDGVKGKTVDLSVGLNGLSNKTYTFDRVFSPAADQTMIFDDVVTPIVDEVLAGFNCTIFAYGQTGTGKTHTMSGDISDMVPLPDNAGIIPRVLHSIFQKLDALPNSPTTGSAPENSIKISFIELYNEELRDLLSPEDTKLKIYDGDGKRGAATLIQGMEEKFITNARKGVQLLRSGSQRRQVAATKCNDLSSRSHTVFTVAITSKRRCESGEECVSTGKLNLVDLAGSENIQRSGAENKRAAEAGLINKSLLTLGRVINALVDRSAHIPYRESKLTRILQDSLGGRTKTCIIATLSPARTNLEETISTLDYAFRAKNIRNKPQINSLVPKKTLLKEFTVEIEKLKSELIATRLKNGVYLAQETFRELTSESESRRVLVKEQQERIETIECNLKNKVLEFFHLTHSFNSLKKDSEALKIIMDSTKSLLEKTEAVLDHTRKSLDNEVQLRQHHERSKERLADQNRELVSSLDQTNLDIGGLQAKLRRRSDLHNVHRQHWADAQKDVSEVTTMLDDKLQKLKEDQQLLANDVSGRMQDFVQHELQKLSQVRRDFGSKLSAFNQLHQHAMDQSYESKSELVSIVGEVESLRDDAKHKLSLGLDELQVAAQRISAGIMTEIELYHAQVYSSYSTIGREVKSTFDELAQEIVDQREELNMLRRQHADSNDRLQKDQTEVMNKFMNTLSKEEESREQENKQLLERIQQLVEAHGVQQRLRMLEIGSLPQQFRTSTDMHLKAHGSLARDSQKLLDRSVGLSTKLAKSTNMIEQKIQQDRVHADHHATALRTVTRSVQDETRQSIQKQVKHVDTEMRALDHIFERIQEQTDEACTSRERLLTDLATNVQTTYGSVEEELMTSRERVETFQANLHIVSHSMQEILPALEADGSIRRALAHLHKRIESDQLEEYVPTGLTPERKDHHYPSSLAPAMLADVSLKSPTKSLVFADKEEADPGRDTCSRNSNNTVSSSTSLRELNLNILATPQASENDGRIAKRQRRDSNVVKERKCRNRALRSTVDVLAEGENLTVPNLSAGVGMDALPSIPPRRLRSHDRIGLEL